MRIMVNGEQRLNIVEHIILRNFWEYYVTDQKHTDNENIKTCLVIGFETEIGDVYIPEIKPYIITRTKKLNEVMPAVGWNWL